jgi:hypothetical protein
LTTATGATFPFASLSPGYACFVSPDRQQKAFRISGYADHYVIRMVFVPRMISRKIKMPRLREVPPVA